MKITHLTTKAAWETAQNVGEYRAESLETEGFIHCSTAGQILGVANNFYRGIPDLVLLWLETTRVIAEIRWEDPVHPSPPLKGADEDKSSLFPHVYGPINLDGIIEVVDFLPDEDGMFRKIPGISS